MEGPAKLPPGQAALRILLLCAVGYVILASYSFARPAVEALFLEDYGSGRLPYVWLVVAVGVVPIVGLYNVCAARIRLVPLFAWSTFASAALLVGLLLCRRLGIPGTTFALYVWKDIYIVLLVETFWAFANVVFPIRTARWIYGIFLVAGAAGSITGNLGVGWLAARFGTANAVWASLPLLLLGVAGCVAVGDASGAVPRQGARRREGPRAAACSERTAGVTASCRPSETAPAGWLAGLDVLRRSRYVLLMLALVAAVQVAMTLVDYVFNGMVETAFSSTDERTRVIGRVYAAIDVGQIVLQLSSGPILRVLGAPVTLLLIPVVISATLLGFLAVPGAVATAAARLGGLSGAPSFVAMSVVKIAGKVFDYSIFRVAKEILYIPLSYEEKTQGKAFVDVMTYRVAKGGASLLLLLLGAVLTAGLVAGLALLGVGVWLVVTILLVRAYRRRVSRAEELGDLPR